MLDLGVIGEEALRPPDPPLKVSGLWGRRKQQIVPPIIIGVLPPTNLDESLLLWEASHLKQVNFR
jgi:hypothetical protein